MTKQNSALKGLAPENVMRHVMRKLDEWMKFDGPDSDYMFTTEMPQLKEWLTAWLRQNSHGNHQWVK